jgi:hypothetical protein
MIPATLETRRWLLFARHFHAIHLKVHSGIPAPQSRFLLARMPLSSLTGEDLSVLEMVSFPRLSHCPSEVLGRSASAGACALTDAALQLAQQFCLRSGWYSDPPCCPSSTSLPWGDAAQRSLGSGNVSFRGCGGSRWCSASTEQEEELATHFSAADQSEHGPLLGARSSGGCWCWSWLATGRTEVVVVEGSAHSATGQHSQMQLQR